MNLFRASLVAATLALLSFSTTASAITYQLLDHGFGALGPDYGLRVDSVGEVFSTEIGSANIILDWDGGTTATISGTLNANTAGGNGGVGPTWTVNYVLTGVSASGGGFIATGGSGTLTDPSAVDTALVAEINGSGNAFELLADGHRLPGDSTSLVGRGWLLPPSSTDDWLVRASVIPEPGTAILLGLGLATLASSRRR